jgi:hypothetical protein
MMGHGGDEPLRASRRGWQIQVLAIVAYTLLALALTWPLPVHFGNYVPGNGADDPPLTWNLWWARHALLQRGSNPFHSDYLFYPLGINLAFYTLTLLNGLLSLPLQAIVGLIPATNLLLLSSFVLSGYGTFLLALHFLRTTHHAPRATRHVVRIAYFAAFLAGVVYAFASSKMFYAALGQWNIASSQWIPFYVLFLFKTGEQPRRWRYPLFAALFLVLQAYAELTYASFLVLFTAVWLVWRCWARCHLALRIAARCWARWHLALPTPARSRARWHLALPTPARSRARWHLALPTAARSRARWHLALPTAARNGDLGRQMLGVALNVSLNVSLIGAVFVAGLAPVLAAMLPELRAEGNVFGTGGGFADVFSADLLGFLVPTMHHPLFGSLVDRFHFDHTVGQHIYLGYVVLILAVVGAVTWRRRAEARFWSFSALVFWLLTLGPTLRIDGHNTGIPLPFALVARLPFFEGNRYPSRYSVMLMLSLAILVAFGMHWLLGRAASSKQQGTRYGLLLAACCLLLFEHLSAPLPLSDMQVPPVYETIAAMPGDFTLLDLPVAWRNGARVTGTQDPIIMFEQYYQSVHHRPILAGNTSRNPPLKFQYFTEAPVINTLIALETGHAVPPAVVEGDRVLATDVLRFFDIQAIVVHPAQAGPDVVPYVEATMPVQRFYEGEGTIAYGVELPPWPAAWTIAPGDALARLSYAEGWGVPANGVIWAQRKAVRLLVPMDGRAQQMAFRAYAPQSGQRLTVEVNGQPAQRVDMAAGWARYEIELPAGQVHEGLNEVWLRFGRLVPAGQVRLSPRAIGQTGAESPVNLVVYSAGQEVGNFGHIYVDGRDVSPGGRGYNVAVIDPQTGAVEDTANFDTHLDEGASQALAAFLAKVPAGHIVAVAAADEASRLLGPEAVAALHGIGAEGDLREKFRWGQAIIGVQDAAPGTALEAMDGLRPVVVVAGEGATEPSLAAAFATITFTAIPEP